jgi:hypothetical protein
LKKRNGGVGAVVRIEITAWTDQPERSNGSVRLN